MPPRSKKKAQAKLQKEPLSSSSGSSEDKSRAELEVPPAKPPATAVPPAAAKVQASAASAPTPSLRRSERLAKNAAAVKDGDQSKDGKKKKSKAAAPPERDVDAVETRKKPSKARAKHEGIEEHPSVGGRGVSVSVGTMDFFGEGSAGEKKIEAAPADEFEELADSTRSGNMEGGGDRVEDVVKVGIGEFGESEDRVEIVSSSQNLETGINEDGSEDIVDSENKTEGYSAKTSVADVTGKEGEIAAGVPKGKTYRNYRNEQTR